MNINPIGINSNFKGNKFSQADFNKLINESKNLSKESLPQYAENLSKIDTAEFNNFVKSVKDPHTQNRLKLHKTIVDKYQEKLNLLIKICNNKIK